MLAAESDVEGLLVALILDGRVQGHIDQVRRFRVFQYCITLNP